CVLTRPLACVVVQASVLRRGLRADAWREPSKVVALLLRRAVLGVLLRDLAEVRALVQRARDIGHLLQLIGERLKVPAHGPRSRDLYLGDVDLGGRRRDGLVLPALGEFVAKKLVTGVGLDVVRAEAGTEPA